MTDIEAWGWHLKCWKIYQVLFVLWDGIDNLGLIGSCTLMLTLSQSICYENISWTTRMTEAWGCKVEWPILFYSILFYSILFYSILFYSNLFYSIVKQKKYALQWYTIQYTSFPNKSRKNGLQNIPNFLWRLYIK